MIFLRMKCNMSDSRCLTARLSLRYFSWFLFVSLYFLFRQREWLLFFSLHHPVLSFFLFFVYHILSCILRWRQAEKERGRKKDCRKIGWKERVFLLLLLFLFLFLLSSWDFPSFFLFSAHHSSSYSVLRSLHVESVQLRILSESPSSISYPWHVLLFSDFSVTL